MSRVRAGRAFIDVGIRDRVSRELQAIANNVQAVGARIARIGFGGAAIGGGIVTGFVPAIKAASDFEESLNRFNAVFGNNAQAARQFAQEFGDAIGRSESDLLDSLSTFQGFFVGLNFDGGDAAGLSQTITQLTRDFASFNNLTDQEASDRFISALSGSSEVLDQFGINIKAVALDQEFLNQGLDVTNATATEQQKVLARLAIISRSLGQQGAIGDATTTAGSFANQLKRLQAQATDLQVSIGNALLPTLPTLTSFITRLGDVVERVVQFAEANPQLIQTVFGIGAALAAGGAAVGTFGLGLVAAGKAASVLASGANLAVKGVSLLASSGRLIAGLAPLFANPVGAALGLSAAIIGVGAAVGAAALASTEGGQQLIASIASSFSAVFGIAQDTVSGIVQALSSGQIALAGQIALVGLKAVFLEGAAQILENWRTWLTNLGLAATDLLGQLQNLFVRFFGFVVEQTNNAVQALDRLRRGDFSGAVAFAAGIAANLSIGLDFVLDEDKLRNAARNGADAAKAELQGLLDELNALQQQENAGADNQQQQNDILNQINALQQQARQIPEAVQANIDGGNIAEQIANAQRDVIDQNQIQADQFQQAAQRQRGSVIAIQAIDRLLSQRNQERERNRELGPEDFFDGIRQLRETFQNAPITRWA